jgi:ubiquitin carboxyl-terminal hydrolase 2
MNIESIQSNINKAIFIDRGKVGLPNLGNTCYFNSILQCLVHSIYFPHFFLSGSYKKYIKSNVNTDILSKLDRFMSKYWLENVPQINPNDLLQSIRYESKQTNFDQFQIPNKEEDAHEFITFFIDRIHDKICKKVIITIEGSPCNDRDRMAIDANKSWITYFKQNYSAMVTLFYGQFCSSIYQPNGKIKSSNYDPFNTLELQIPTHIRNCSIYDCLDEFTKKEELDKYDSTQPQDTYYRKLSFWKTPHLLIICFKRFNNMARKLNNHVLFPIYRLNLSKYSMKYEEDSALYNLYGVCNHVGNSFSGHYYAYCKNENNKWYEYNDDKVNEIKESNLNTQHAYCLFYKKIL